DARQYDADAESRPPARPVRRSRGRTDTDDGRRERRRALMLSRDADSCFWIGRYVERAEATARMVDVHYHAALEAALPAFSEEENAEVSPMRWHSILAISGIG